MAEDNPVNRKIAIAFLEKRGHVVTVAENGQIAAELAGRETFDLILMDVQMPVMGGFDATRIIRERERELGGHIPILALTARAMKGDREQCLAAGMDSYLTKPFRADELYATVDALVAATPNLRLGSSMPGVSPNLPPPPFSSGSSATGSCCHRWPRHSSLASRCSSTSSTAR